MSARPEGGRTAAERIARCARSAGLRVAAAESVTAGGPGPTEGRPPGTAFIAVVDADGAQVREYHFEGEPAEVVRSATEQALRDLAAACERRTATAG